MRGKIRMESPIRSYLLPGCCCGVSDREGVCMCEYILYVCSGVCVCVCVFGGRGDTDTEMPQSPLQAAVPLASPVQLLMLPCADLLSHQLCTKY